jgi:hypothetical protein
MKHGKQAVKLALKIDGGGIRGGIVTLRTSGFR